MKAKTSDHRDRQGGARNFTKVALVDYQEHLEDKRVETLMDDAMIQCMEDFAADLRDERDREEWDALARHRDSDDDYDYDDDYYPEEMHGDDFGYDYEDYHYNNQYSGGTDSNHQRLTDPVDVSLNDLDPFTEFPPKSELVDYEERGLRWYKETSDGGALAPWYMCDINAVGGGLSYLVAQIYGDNSCESGLGLIHFPVCACCKEKHFPKGITLGELIRLRLGDD